MRDEINRLSADDFPTPRRMTEAERRALIEAELDRMAARKEPAPIYQLLAAMGLPIPFTSQQEFNRRAR